MSLTERLYLSSPIDDLIKMSNNANHITPSVPRARTIRGNEIKAYTSDDIPLDKVLFDPLRTIPGIETACVKLDLLRGSVDAKHHRVIPRIALLGLYIINGLKPEAFSSSDSSDGGLLEVTLLLQLAGAVSSDDTLDSITYLSEASLEHAGSISTVDAGGCMERKFKVLRSPRPRSGSTSCKPTPTIACGSPESTTSFAPCAMSSAACASQTAN